MAGSRLPPEKLKHAMSLSRFMLRSQVLKLYRDMMRIVYNLPDLDQRKALKDFIRHDFECNKNVEDEEAIKMFISKGKISLRELENTVPRGK
ncbi:LYR motif-containing protein 2-like [Mizuhopecten yessoensis]|uniref:LYR motif-containing protein 2 n=1 Tax=Mizuhopecten yessoensis TaxID=6573 RepID=A0A210PME3_MIZYE|nr:LYR motif-containing protein 2-like [Mizuhopecten yessoensis]OWF37670.1 LYR motif-containing protein 2 [Mizuhopecten yessoensis]